MSNEKHELNTDVLISNLDKIAYALDKVYLSRLDCDYSVRPYDEYNSEEITDKDGQTNRISINTYVSNVRALKIQRLVYDKEQNFTDCLQNAISVFSNSGNTIAFVFNRYSDSVEAFAVVRNDGQGKNDESKANIALFADSLAGNFPGSSFEIIEEKQSKGQKTMSALWPIINKDAKDNSAKPASIFSSISAICNIPSAKSSEYLSQNLEKVLNSIVPKTDKEVYSIVIIAESLSPDRIRAIREGLEELATNVYPFLQHQFQAGENNAESYGEIASLSHTESTSIAISKTHSVNIGINGSRFLPGGMIGASLGYGFSKGKTTTEGTSDTATQSRSNGITIGKSETTSYNYQSYAVKNVIERLEQSLERVKKGDAIGLWKYATYVCASSSRLSRNVANYIKALTQGNQSFVEPAIIKEWHKESQDGISNFDEVLKYIIGFTHPVFLNSRDGMAVDFSVNLNTFELANIIALPQHSVQGIPVTHGVSFGREPHSLTRIEANLDLGCGYHMFEEISNTRICLSTQELTKHTFITGSTGSGKTNTIYKLLEKAGESGVKFLVIEPVKGEYRTTIGKMENVTTYGTNPCFVDIQLLKINPFSFPAHTHVLEHLDRLVEIFNVCWPMYAAMPAILKDAIERAYVKSGWDLEKSYNKYSEKLFPSFNDVVREIRLVLNESEYSADNKGDYTGALVTRVNSLTNGINGLIFSADEISNISLFDNNVIVDLSRVGSSETKSLIMGLLVLKLQEYRMEQQFQAGAANEQLKHITVLEEAHNLLKRVGPSNPGQELIGKSVEMLANSIAEMRTYGEGFIVSDQSPGLLDMSVIRNTNTKIILRLPDYNDRELVGKASGLTENQIIELARLEKGVAAISQSDWIEPVLCKIDLFECKDELKKAGLASIINPVSTIDVSHSLLECIMTKEIYRENDRTEILSLKESVLRSGLSTLVKRDFLDYVSSDEKTKIDSLRTLVYDFLNAENAFAISRKHDDIYEWTRSMAKHLSPSVSEYSKAQIDLVIALLVYEQSIRDASYNDLLCKYTELYKLKGGVL